jgi:hypothetical protein
MRITIHEGIDQAFEIASDRFRSDQRLAAPEQMQAESAMSNNCRRGRHV